MPPPIKLLDEGHDVWYIYSRGTTYSEKNDSNTVYDAGFWDYTFEDLGVYDIKASVDFVQTKTGKKPGIIANQTGATLVFAGLASDYDWYKEHVYKVAMVQPCTILSPDVF